ncbi:hypothetical protein HPP92_011557 [Vanilla planifolia]|uniref:Uncharacterized protein n=1 Tax=Vanilla planifolia TaxID=51239 RepID=A0A835UYJ8_VANPL|nr:hypothetical protein HPP92_011557 [Vanilla planifolia]
MANDMTRNDITKESTTLIAIGINAMEPIVRLRQANRKQRLPSRYHDSFVNLPWKKKIHDRKKDRSPIVPLISSHLPFKKRISQTNLPFKKRPYCRIEFFQCS